MKVLWLRSAQEQWMAQLEAIAKRAPAQARRAHAALAACLDQLAGGDGQDLRWQRYQDDVWVAQVPEHDWQVYFWQVYFRMRLRLGRLEVLRVLVPEQRPALVKSKRARQLLADD